MTFDDLVRGGVSALQLLVEQRTEETPELEFKQKSNAQITELQKDDRKALGESLSGFANAVGGVLIVGMKTERPDGVDRACAISEIDNIEQVADRYRSYITECVAPPIEGIRVGTINTAPTKGVIVLHVPRGSARPHMSTAPGHQRYYRRVADNFVPMMHYEIDEMMRLKVAPNLKLILEYENGGSIGGNPKSFLRFGLRNDSNVTAKYPYIGVEKAQNAPRLAEYGLDGNGNTLWNKLTTSAAGNDTIFAAGSDMVLHPGQALFVSRLEYLRDADERLGRYWSLASLPDGQDVELKFVFGCEDAAFRALDLSLSKEQLLNHILPPDSRLGLGNLPHP